MSILILIGVILIFIAAILTVLGLTGAFGGDRVKMTKLDKIMFSITCVLFVSGLFCMAIALFSFL